MSQPPMEQWYREYKPLLFSIAYRMLGAVSEAEDIVHDLFLTIPKLHTEAIHNTKAYLCKAVTHRCIDYLESARVRREQYVGPWLPEPLLYDAASHGDDPLWLAERNDDISFALLLLLERLNPVERAIFVLRQAFDYDYKDIAEILGRSEAACRKTFSRLKEKLEAERPSAESDELQTTEPLVRGFLQAVDTGDVEQFLHLLTEDAILLSDGGGKVRSAVRPILGADRVAAFLLGVNSKRPDSMVAQPAVINGSPGIVHLHNGRPYSMMLFELLDSRVHRVYVVRNPDKMRHVKM
ncbi:RNA polymerase sigma-70 factor [Paenibacillus allorhizosphaerae]|uniref:ECF RNA polymerase sigma factor SigJ n=1 Tax=Paenibacillus allorhizosphaerae TaxID=2849866 RepID=A0ABM8VQP8_9BACL|nr:RNA polymerase sigma-70 factor [Paenibacillus allorhizosphaerae]CAG7654462.1 ECF RNA polymerase sigma factor SigJ [Paenibacillus allorhizosphaerae]